MMDERELDRAIDTAAGRMIRREPSRALTHAVMTRVRPGAAPAPRRLRWVVATASIVLCAAAAIALMNRAPAAVITLPTAAQQPVVQGQGAQSPIAAASAPGAVAVRVRNVPSPASLPKALLTIDVLTTEPITVSAIEVPQLERETTLIDILDVEPLTIEPLAASND